MAKPKRYSIYFTPFWGVSNQLILGHRSAAAPYGNPATAIKSAESIAKETGRACFVVDMLTRTIYHVVGKALFDDGSAMYVGNSFESRIARQPQEERAQ